MLKSFPAEIPAGAAIFAIQMAILLPMADHVLPVGGNPNRVAVQDSSKLDDLTLQCLDCTL